MATTMFDAAAARGYNVSSTKRTDGESMTKRIVSIQDLSCIGRCSLAVAMSVIPAMGVETAVLPTAILSTHTAFESFTFLDFTPEAERIMREWKKLGMRFDAVYIGYLGSLQLVELTRRFLALFHEEGMHVILDPAFGDHGRLYTGFDMAYVQGIRALCAEADVILPNVTEACMLLDLPYGEDAATTRLLKSHARELLGGRLKNAIITSCRFDDGQTGLLCAGDADFAYPHEHLPFACHGSGDLFASVFSGFLTRGRDVETSARLAADFTFDCIRHSMNCPDHRWYGVDYEGMLPRLMKLVHGSSEEI